MRQQIRCLLAALFLLSCWGLPDAAPDAALAAPDQSDGADMPESAPVVIAGGVVSPNTYNDEWSNGSNAASTDCSLREALAMLLNDQGGNRGCGTFSQPVPGGTLNLSPGTYRLTLPLELPNIGSGYTINILDSGATIDGGSQSANRHLGIFVVKGGTLNLKKLTLKRGSRSGGGAVWMDVGTLTAEQVNFVDNDAKADPALDGYGGAILVGTGTLTVTNSLFEKNAGYDGGGAVSTSFGYFYKDTFIDNQAAFGGALYIPTPTTDPVFVVDTRFKGNKARPQLPTEMPAAGYHAKDDIDGGGAIYNNGNLQVTQALLEGNSTELNKGGGALINAGQAELLETAVFNNLALNKGSGDTNNNVDYTWGGGIFNAGTLKLIRTSVYNNQASYAGGIFNHLPGQLNLYNSTVSNNTARVLLGGIVNEHPLFDFAVSPGATVNLLHATIGKNNPSDPTLNQLYALDDRSVIFGNSILDGQCNQPQYTHGNSVMTGPCVTIDDPGISPQIPNTDISNTSFTTLQLLPLSPGALSLPQVQVQKLGGTSNAEDIGRDDQFGCSNGFIARRDQNFANRGPACDAGAIEGGQNPPIFSSTPGPGGRVFFPRLDINSLPSTVNANLTLRNTGGGVVSYTVELGEGYGSITLLSPPSGTIGPNGQAVLTFECAPTGWAGDRWRNVSLTTNTHNQPRANYDLRCTVAGTTQQASTDQPPGPLNLPNQPAGQTSHAQVTVSNAGSQSPMTASGAYEQGGPPFSSSAALMDTQGQAAPLAPGSPAATLNPGQSLTFDLACSPTDYMVHVDTFVITTNDPINPHLRFSLACEARVDSPPEPLVPSGEYASGAGRFEGLAVSPDGSQVAAGRPDSSGALHIFSRNAATGALTPAGTLSTGGMTFVYGVAYSHDGQNVYYTSSGGNGIVTLDRSNNNLNFTQVITAGTTYICQINPFKLCGISTLTGAHGLAVSPDDQYVYVTGYTSGTLTVLQRLSNGSLSYVQGLTRTQNGANVLGGAARVAVSPDGAHVYVAATTDDTVAVFQRNSAGRLDFVAAYKDGVAGLNNLNQPEDVALSPDGQFVYATSSVDGALNIFSRSSADGQLTLASVITGLTSAYGVALTGDNLGERLFLAQYSADQVRVYARSVVSGTLGNPLGLYSNLTGTSNINGPVFIAVSPDNRDIYVSLFDGQAVRHFTTQRNQPLVTHLSPASAPAGGAGFDLAVVGGRFYPDSKIVWAGTPLSTQFVSEHELHATVTAGLIAAQGSANVSVRNTSPGGGDSLPLPFAITGPSQPPVPSIVGTVPDQVVAGEDDIDVYVQGANFAPDAQAYYNLIPVPTLFINDHTLLITLWATLLEEPGTGGLQVVNGGGLPALAEASGPGAPAASASSPVVSFNVAPPGHPARPALASLEPASVISGSADLWITVHGHNFSASGQALSIGRWNGQARPTVVLDGETLLVQALQADLAQPGNPALTVLTPGADESAPLSFRVRAPGEKPVPVVSSFALRGWTLYVNGSDFDPGAQIRLNGVARATTFVSAEQLKASVSPVDKGLVITVFNPAPGGGLSNGLVVYLRYIFLPLIRR